MSKQRLLRGGAGCALVLACLSFGGAAQASDPGGGTTVGFDTGTFTGSILSTSGTPPPGNMGAQVRATATNGSGQSTFFVGADGHYTATVPVGDYNVEAFFGFGQWSLGTRLVTVTKDAPLANIDFTFRAGTVHAKVGIGVDEASATFVQNAQVTFRELPPSSCTMDGASCTFFSKDPTQPSGDCQCTIGGRQYTCFGGTCQWSNPRTFSTFTGSDGNMTSIMPEGTFTYEVDSGQASGGLPGMGMQQSGWARVASGTTTVVDGAVDDLGTTLYETGQVGGTISGILPGQSVMVQAQATDNSGYFNAWVGDPTHPNTYSLVLPNRSYRLTVLVNGAPVQAQTVAVDIGSTIPLDFTLTSSTRVLSGQVFRDGQGIYGAMVTGYEVPPAGLACNPSCAYTYTSTDPMTGGTLTKCDQCPLPDGRLYGCFDMGTGPTCFLNQGHSFNATSGSDGTFSAQVAPGTYNVQVYSGQEGGPGTPPPPPPAPPTMMMMQMGNVLVSTLSSVVVADTDVSLGAISYATGIISGTATSCGMPLGNVSIAARSPTNGGQISAFDDSTGHYSLRVPVGDYDTQLLWQYMYGTTSTSLHVSEATTTPYNFSLDLGTVSGLVVMNGNPSAFSPVQIVEKGPASCTVAGAVCATTKTDPATGSTYCDCTLGSRRYFCQPQPTPTGPGPVACQWADQHRFNSMTGSDGHFTTSVFAGDYTVIAYAPSGGMPGPGPGPAPMPGPMGQIEVARWDASVLACGATNTAEASKAIDTTTGVAAFGSGVTLTFPTDSPLLGKTVSVITTTTPPPSEVSATPPDPTLSFDGAFYDFKLTDGTNVPAGQTVRVCLDYEHVDTSNHVIYHYTLVAGSMQWVPLDNITIASTSDPKIDEICGDTPSFSWFTVAKKTVTAPVVSVSAPASGNADGSCAFTAHVDASATTNAPTSFAWKLDGVALAGTGSTNDVALAGVGPHVVSVTASNAGGSNTKDVTITVADVTPPVFTATLAPSVIWPPDGKMVKLTPTFTVSDNCTAPTVAVVSLVGSNGSVADVSTTGGLSVRADRSGTEKSGRTYTATWTASDGKQSTTATASVLVPHDQSK